ncbi:Chromosome partition protein Smc [Campylobacter majalis]|uniref:Chromosome partition protein Smc n=1 Tax=Campylobacter majalis TaxID=2790656 RepID=A0ABM8Q632_9BACT|nr:autotransporter domain-containing protein [Campylobacter majalis]CAD7288360.1 Chromosome partition protein Smc [Campylobacter majalis]
MKFSKIACIAIIGASLSTGAFASLKDDIVARNEAEASLDIVKMRLKQYSKEIDQLKAQQKKDEEQIKLTKAQEEKATAQKEAADNAFKQLNNQKTEKDAEIEKQSKIRKDNLDKIQDPKLKEAISNNPQRGNIEDITKELDELTKMQDFTSKTKEDLQEDLNKVSKQLNGSSSLLQGQADRLEQIKRAVADAQEDDISNDLKIINDYIKEIKEEAQRNKDILSEDVVNSIADSAEKIKQLQGELEKIVKNLDQKTKEQVSAEAQLNAVKRAVQDADGAKKHTETSLQNAEAALNKAKGDIAPEEEKLKQAQAKLDQTRQQLGANAKQEEKKAMFEILDDSKKNLAQKEKQQQQDAKSLQEAKDKLAKKIDEVIDPGVLSQEDKTQEGINRIKRGLDAIKSELPQVAQQYKKEVALLAFQSVRGQVDSNLKDIHKKLDEIENKISSVADDSDMVNKKDDIGKVVKELQALAEEKSNKIRAADAEIGELEDKVSTANDQLLVAKGNIEDAKEALQNAKNGMKDVGVFVDAKNKQEEQVAEALFDKGIMTRKTPDSDIVAISDSLSNASDNIHANAPTKITKFNSELSTKTRLAKLSNPFNENLALAYAINNLKGEAFADSGDTLGSVVRTYTDRYKYDNNLWANAIGAKASLKNDAKAKMYGFSLGYDKVFDDTIVGGFTTLAKSKHEDRTLTNKANNYEVGVYARHFMYNHEIDTKVSFGVAKNKTNRSVVLSNGVSKNDGKYTSKFASFDLNYGYVFDLTNAAFVKPAVGLSYLWLKNGQLKENGNLPVNINAKKYKELTLNLSTEIRKYVADGSYFYIQPGFEREIYKAQDDASISFVGSKNNIVFDKDKSKKGYFTLQTGAEFAITPTLSTNINFGLKTKEDEKYYSGTFGVRYKF